MPASGKVTYEGTLRNINQAEFEGKLQATLDGIGVVGVQIMREEMASKLPNGDATGNTRKSVMFMTKNTPGKPEHDDPDEIIDTPKDDNTVYIGSAHPNAVYMEYGTSSHVSSKDKQKFLDAIREWMGIRGIDEKYFWPIVKKIRAEGTDARPYATESARKIGERASSIIGDVIAEFIKTRPYKKPYNTGWNQEVGE